MSLIETLSLFEILLIAAVIFMILIFIFRIQIKFLLTRLIYGRYHYKYLRLYNRYLINRPYPDAIKDEPWDYILSVFKTQPKVEFETKDEIGFANYKVGKQYDNFFRKNGDPDYLTISDPHSKLPHFIVAGYRALVYDYEAMLVYFFIDNMLVMGQFRFRREKEAIDAASLIQKLNRRYAVHIPTDENNAFTLKDNDGNRIVFRDTGFSVELNIYNPDIEWIQKMMGNLGVHFGSDLQKKDLKESAVTF
ncbi:MAG: hypothetical protein KQI35_02200 [Bacteroidetes bacterium]|nr:hypothetical protein [Bacteroidota bacterium]